VSLLAVAAVQVESPPADEKLWEHRNLGKAFYENPDTHVQAADEERAALQLAPNSVMDRVNYGLALLRAGQTDQGTTELLQAQKQDPTIPHTWFNLGIVYKHAGDYEKAMAQLREMIRLVPAEPIAHYNLAAVLRATGNVQAALPEFLEAERLNPNLAGPHFQLYSIYQRTGDKDAAARERQLFDEVKKRTEGAAVPEDMEWCFYAELYDPPVSRASAAGEPTKYDENAVSNGWDVASTKMLVIDSVGAGSADLLVWSKDRIELLKHGTDAAPHTGLEGLKGVQSIAAGDFDNDGLTDLCIVSETGASVYRNVKGTFAKAVDLPHTTGVTKALWLDYDHDYDLDLLLFGADSHLMRNDGNGKFEDRTSSFPFVSGQVLDAVVTAVRGDTAARDVLVSYADRVGTLYTDKLNEKFEASDLPAITAGSAGLDVQDVNNDGLLDIVVHKPEVFAALNDGAQFKLASKGKVNSSSIRADFNGDGREDYVRLTAAGSVHLYTNASSSQKWLAVRPEGVKNLKEAVDATVEMKSGAYFEKRIYEGVPITFAMDSRSDADTIRITWPNGLIQNETRKMAGGLLRVPEAQRLSGSCPMIFTWNGTQFQFITDVLGVAPLGASSGDGSYFPVDHDEYIQIPGEAVKTLNGKYQIHITEELHEVSYLDKVQLIALDHQADVDVYTNDKFKSPPYPEFRLFRSAGKIHPLRALDDHGRDVTASVEKQDHTYPHSFPHNSAGVAGLHTLDVDFGKVAQDNRAALVLNGWVDWADGSTFLGAAQDGNGGLVFPYLQVKDASGKWQTVVQDMGIPSGKPKTIVVDLTGKFLSSSREVRIVTNLCVYWDEIFLLPDARAPQVRMTPIDASAADLHFRGFSRVVIDPKRQQPEQFVYSDVRFTSNWNPTPGLYTRYGDVQPLLTKMDDQLVIMGSGDELKLEYPADQLPLLPKGWKRDFLLLVDGWAKDADANTAFSQSVTPLPFHAMSAYPYKMAEHFPNDAIHQEYVSQYLTRPALRLIRPLAMGGGTQ